MQRILVSQLEIGMVTARHVFSADGRMLLAADQNITEAYIRRLQELGVGAVYVKNPFVEDVEIPLVLREATRMESLQSIKRGFEVLRSERTDLPFEELRMVARKIVGEIIRNRQAMIHITEIRAHDDYTFAHSVDVCSTAVLIASNLGYVEARLNEMAVGALLHDVGKIQVDPALLNKPERLTDDEMILMRAHALNGFEILRKESNIFSVPSMQICLQHHEKHDGSGYPRALKSDEIHEFAKIVSIADVYDAVTSDRPYRKAFLPHEAYELMSAEMGRHFDPGILPAFLNRIAVYPLGTVVRLNTGDLGMVSLVEPGMQTRPVIRLIMDKHRRLYPKGSELDMRNHLTVFVDQVVEGKVLFNLL